MSVTYSTNANAMKIKRGTLFEEGIPHIIAPDVYDHIFARGCSQGERVLVHRKIIAYQDQNYIIDYITSSSDEGWCYSKVAYRSQSPFPHTVDSRASPSVVPPPPSFPFSSSTFRAAAYAQATAIPSFQ
jgi:hypothetical protein